MSYQVLARKWRPRSFADMVGQSHVLKALTNALDQDRLHHAYLFTGTRGVGKTTLARILAKCLNCEKGVSANPCGVCTACVGIDEGRFIDLIEVDAASRAKVEETRDLMDNVQYAPTAGRYKIYLIDEIHMFSNHSFNALLKTLEEPPPHVKFLLATTEPKKLPVTILSRCLQFNLRHLTADQISEQLTKILQTEKIEHDVSSINLIARSAQGSMRDALSLIDQAISHGGGELEEGQVRNMLGTIDIGDLTELVSALVNQDGRSLLNAIDQMAAHNPDYDTVLAELLSLLQKAALAQVLSGDASVLIADNELIGVLSETLSKEDIQLYYQIGLTGRRDLTIAPDPKAGFEMILIRMLAFKPGEAAMFQHKDDPKVVTSPISSPVTALPTGPAENAAVTPEQKKQLAQSKVSEWKDIIDEMALAGLVKELAGHCVLRSHTADKVELVLRPAQECLLNSTQRDRLESAIKTRFGNNVRIIINVEDFDTESPAQKKVREANEKKQAAVESLEHDPNVKAIIDAFDGSLDRDSVSTK